VDYPFGEPYLTRRSAREQAGAPRLAFEWQLWHYIDLEYNYDDLIVTFSGR